ncbi:MAG: 5-methyltetrahydropteroyltriglutamate--homocysteine S-methyltransferase [Sulfurospirillaceae bacterium]|nr:5-methyltetrahydropteroyltriglutamate--homocysteine S-methyltransferase [Sulfurospirillaceae bacterium]
MSKNYVIGFPRIGEQRELKKVLERFWDKKAPFHEVEKVAKELRKRHWEYQKNANIEYISSNDFSLYDNMLDTIVMINAIPKRFQDLTKETLYFTMARGDENRVAMEMTKWFNTNYHYIVPELSQEDHYKANASKILNEYIEAKELGITTKINLIGPLTFLGLSKRTDGKDPYEFLGSILPIYQEVISQISTLGDEITVQIDEPIFVKDLEPKVLSLIKPTYEKLSQIASNVKLIVTSYFEHSNEATKILVNSPIWGLGLDFVHGAKNLETLDLIAKNGKNLIAGVIDGRNIWKNDFQNTLDLLGKITQTIQQDHLIIGSSCSLLHVPFTLRYEENMNPEIKNWLSFAVEKLDEISTISRLFFEDYPKNKSDLSDALRENTEANRSRRTSKLIHDDNVKQKVANLQKFQRDGDFHERIKIQRALLKYGDLTTTTIGSFPQTQEIRAARSKYKNHLISKKGYESYIKHYIDECIAFQEKIDLDVLVHGEPERNDMVEYFGEQLQGYGFTQNGWVQSYGSRCVKPPFIYGDISRPQPMSVQWITYAQSKTKKIVKGMLTGPITILNWSFVRDDKPRHEVAQEIAIAISDEVDDLQNAGIKIIQIDEAAFKEGYPLRASHIKEYEKWAVANFKLCASRARKETQIHTHMCYSEFNDIIKTIEAMDADVITIETARSGNELLKIFKKVGYKQEIGPGVYDIHSPRVPSIEEIAKQIRRLLEVLPKEQLWINPDCGLKTRGWKEVKQSLENMVEAVKIVKMSL